MNRCVLVVVCFLAPFGDAIAASSDTDIQKSTIQWLKGQINPKTRLVASYSGNPTCWLYDQATAVIAFAEAGVDSTQHARNILEFLRANRSGAVEAEGYWYFAYDSNGNKATDYTTTATNAWVVIAINYYEAKTGDRKFRPMADATLRWIENRCLKSVNGKSGVVMSDRNHANTKYDDTQIFSTEHNVDAYAAFYVAGLISKNKQHLKTASKLESFLVTQVWDGQVFHGGTSVSGKVDKTFYLDAQSWAVLALGPKYGDCLKVAEQKCLVVNKSHDLNGRTVTKVTGFTEWSGSKHYWAEGTEGMVAALRSVGRGETAALYHEGTRRFADGLDGDLRDGKLGVPYASKDAVGVSKAESVAGTTWFYFNERGVNPFRPKMNPKIK